MLREPVGDRRKHPPPECPTRGGNLSVIAQLFRRIDHGMIGRLGKESVMTSDEIVTMAVRIFGDRESAHAWMTTKKASCQGRIPMTMLRTDGGRRVVEGMLAKIDTGTFA
jgi:uncharacterized protein (DUF2384 family)